MEYLPVIPPHMQAVKHPQNCVKRSSLWFCVSFVGIAVFGLAISCWAATKPWFMEHHHVPVLRTLGYGHRAIGMGCEVVLYGDSTALADLVPAVIQKKTGLKSCNISEVRSVGDLVGQYYPLDDYLAHNSPPKYLLSAWSPDNFHLDHGPMLTFTPEAYAYALPYDRDSRLWRGLLLEPEHALTFLVWVQSSLMLEVIDKVLGSTSKRDVERKRREEQAGMWAVQKPPEQACQGGAYKSVSSSFQENKEGVQAFRARYQAKGIRVIVDVTPVANCVADLQAYIGFTKGLSDNSLEVLPIQNFNDQDIHLAPDAAARFSEEASNQILELARRQQGREP